MKKTSCHAAILATLLAVVLPVFYLAGCSKDDDKPTGPDPSTPFPHTAPSAETMQVDVQDLSASDEALPASGACHTLTSLVVAWVNANVALRLAIPGAAMTACLQTPSVYLGELTWRWTATGGQGSNAWTAELTGTVVSTSEIQWAMRISGTPLQLNRFLWFQGTCDPTARAGMWHYFDPQSSQPTEEVIRCTWTLPEEPGQEKRLQFTNMDVNGDYGDTLTYAISDSVASIRHFHQSDIEDDAVSEARWDPRDGSGRWTHWTFFGGEDGCCWGPRPNFPDVDCLR